jgi:hypothetical protein
MVDLGHLFSIDHKNIRQVEKRVGARKGSDWFTLEYGKRSSVSVVRQVVRFYSHVICPLCETKRRGR